MASKQWYTLPDNYIYVSHLGEDGVYIILPNYPDSVQDTMQNQFGQTNALARSAPVFTYVNSGPRSMQVTLQLHRDLMDSVNINVSNLQNKCMGVEFNDYDDYLDKLLKILQAIALPKYNLDNKAVEPPIVALRISDEVFIRGIVSGGVTVTYQKPILSNGKYAQVTVAFNIYETDPYDASTVYKNGGFRGVTRTMKKGFHLED